MLNRRFVVLFFCCFFIIIILFYFIFIIIILVWISLQKHMWWVLIWIASAKRCNSNGYPQHMPYKELDKKYTGCNLKTAELLDYALIRLCAVIRLNTVLIFSHFSTKTISVGMTSFASSFISSKRVLFSTNISLFNITHKGRERERDRDRHTDRQKEREERDRQRRRLTDTERHTHTGR